MSMLSPKRLGIALTSHVPTKFYCRLCRVGWLQVSSPFLPFLLLFYYYIYYYYYLSSTHYTMPVYSSRLLLALKCFINCPTTTLISLIPLPNLMDFYIVFFGVRQPSSFHYIAFTEDNPLCRIHHGSITP